MPERVVHAKAPVRTVI
ncbi:hypothetical protein PO124_15325 [Bacillus licheniformis]|nr:hypothetical protein [Bacillus licheniformis]